MSTDRIEDYLKVIFQIQKGKGFAQVKDISNLLQIGPSSVSLMFKKLQEKGYIRHEKYGGVVLTDKGEAIGRDTTRKHQLIKRFLITLGVGESIADIDACRIEHYLHDETLDRIFEFLGVINENSKDDRWSKLHDDFFHINEEDVH
ncbi:MAG TPA: metal-dependent transcriptional regulator [Candidatus Methanofastidiosa archaeon]|nr:metal-dependent transcriptional regulator [Candidatus Methanofastidiosa archaeon]HPR42638.1 metal-dependent transcriptional regulator [Candidatus Methanofastidiosa archaeon]